MKTVWIDRVTYFIQPDGTPIDPKEAETLTPEERSKLSVQIIEATALLPTVIFAYCPKCNAWKRVSSQGYGVATVSKDCEEYEDFYKLPGVLVEAIAEYRKNNESECIAKIRKWVKWSKKVTPEKNYNYIVDMLKIVRRYVDSKKLDGIIKNMEKEVKK